MQESHLTWTNLIQLMLGFRCGFLILPSLVRRLVSLIYLIYPHRRYTAMCALNKAKTIYTTTDKITFIMCLVAVKVSVSSTLQLWLFHVAVGTIAIVVFIVAVCVSKPQRMRAHTKQKCAFNPFDTNNSWYLIENPPKQIDYWVRSQDGN